VAVGGKIADFTEWDRKNYFYPDIPKGYQISQYKYPLIEGGTLSQVDIERIHLEEDTAKSTHDIHHKSLVDFNRSGVPLMELVTKPVIHDSKTAVRFAKELQLLLRYLGAGEANMEKGEMRVEANISVASPEDTRAGKFGTKTEVKNLNSFRAVERAIEFEIERQSSLLESGQKIKQETRGFGWKLRFRYHQSLPCRKPRCLHQQSNLLLCLPLFFLFLKGLRRYLNH
jgi:aspartyl-tRNA(Asn)/glutamyl-tRNA(Gln) amidotransferase subunit B